MEEAKSFHRGLFQSTISKEKFLENLNFSEKKVCNFLAHGLFNRILQQNKFR